MHNCHFEEVKRPKNLYNGPSLKTILPFTVVAELALLKIELVRLWRTSQTGSTYRTPTKIFCSACFI